MSFRRFVRTQAWLLKYEDGGSNGAGTGAGSGGAGDGGGAGGGGAGDGGASGNPPPGGSSDRTFSQADVNRMLADDRRKHQKQNEQLIGQLEDLKRSKGLSDKERGELATRIEELQTQHMTEAQKAERERAKLKDTHKQELDESIKERDAWRGLYADATITQALTAAAVVEQAFDPDQIIGLLQPRTRITEVLDEDGKPTGRWEPKVKWDDQDKEGKPVTLDMTPADVVKRMKELPKFGNLFKSTAAGGLGTMGGQQGGRAQGGPPKDPEAYRKWRKETGLDRSYRR